MRSVLLQQAHQKAEKYLQSILDKNPGTLSMFDYWVYLIHEDGTVMQFREAFAVKSDNWLMVFPEHYDTYVVDISELLCYAQFERVGILDMEE